MVARTLGLQRCAGQPSPRLENAEDDGEVESLFAFNSIMGEAAPQ